MYLNRTHTGEMKLNKPLQIDREQNKTKKQHISSYIKNEQFNFKVYQKQKLKRNCFQKSGLLSWWGKEE